MTQSEIVTARAQSGRMSHVSDGLYRLVEAKVLAEKRVQRVG